MASSGTLRRVALVRTDFSEELNASFIRVTRIGELGTLVVTNNRRTLRRLLLVELMQYGTTITSQAIVKQSKLCVAGHSLQKAWNADIQFSAMALRVRIRQQFALKH
jgi:hypothetical protein